MVDRTVRFASVSSRVTRVARGSLACGVASCIASCLAYGMLACASQGSTTDTAGVTLRSAPSANALRTISPQTRAEASHYLETTPFRQAVAFLDTLQSRGLPILVDSTGATDLGTPIVYFVASRPLARTPREAQQSGKPIVYVNANIHAGEVEGKEALLALVRDLLQDTMPNVLDSVVLIGVPVYNADGNERFAAQRVNRPEQNGPEWVGTRANGRGLDLNRDYMKAEAGETRASLHMFNLWDPDVYVDLHTTDGSYHHFALTYAPSLSPAALTVNGAADFTRDTLLPELRTRMAARGFKIFDYGNFDPDDESDLTSPTKPGWYSYDHRPRFGTNYFGLRGRISILSEAFSHDPFERRIRSTYAFVSDILSAVADHLASVDRLRNEVAIAPGIPVQATLTKHPYQAELSFEILERTGDSAITQPGVPAGLRRTGRFKTQRMPVYDHFDPTHVVEAPSQYILKNPDSSTVDLLRQHGLTLEPVSSDTTDSVDVFVLDSIFHAERPFQGHRQTRVVGHWVRRLYPIGRKDYVVTPSTRLTALAVYLLDPESDDGLLNWNVFDRSLHAGGDYPVLRLSP